MLAARQKAELEFAKKEKKRAEKEAAEGLGEEPNGIGDLVGTLLPAALTIGRKLIFKI